MRAGRRNKLVTLQRATVTYNDLNEPIETWVNLDLRWSSMIYGSGSERRQAAMEQGSQTASFIMPSDTLTRSITIKDRIFYDGFSWDVVGKVDVSPDIDFTTVCLV